MTSCAVVGLGAAAGGCGSAQTAGHTADPVIRAADVVAQAPGYRMAGTVTVKSPVGPVTATLDGVVDRADRTGSFVTSESVLGHTIKLDEKFSRLTFYMHAPATPQLAQVTHGKPWMKIDMSRMLGSMGLSSLPTSGTDPSQFVDYLRAVGTHTKQLGTATVRGVPTTHYRSTIDLDRYAKLVPPAQRAGAAHGIAALESALGSHTLPVDVWIDGQHRLRQMSMTMAECAAGQRLSMQLTMALYDYGQQAKPQLPSAAQTYDATPALSRLTSKVKLGCPTT